MSDLTDTLRHLAGMFDEMGVQYAVMGGIAVRVYGIPRPTYDVDFTAAVERGRLPELFLLAEQRGYTVPEAYASGWVDQVAGLPLVKLRLYLAGNGVDIDIFLAESAYQRSVLSRAREVRIDSLCVWTVSPEDLILLKLLAHRPRDIADIGTCCSCKASWMKPTCVIGPDNSGCSSGWNKCSGKTANPGLRRSA
jgi:predicted nucleotidyltransferase